jgi:hypothetical protein
MADRPLTCSPRVTPLRVGNLWGLMVTMCAVLLQIPVTCHLSHASFDHQSLVECFCQCICNYVAYLLLGSFQFIILYS